MLDDLGVGGGSKIGSWFRFKNEEQGRRGTPKTLYKGNDKLILPNL